MTAKKKDVEKSWRDRICSLKYQYHVRKFISVLDKSEKETGMKNIWECNLYCKEIDLEFTGC